MSSHTMNLADVLDAAASAMAAGDLDTAKLGCERVLQTHRDQPNALHLMGLIAHRRRDFARAVRLLQRSIERRNQPDAAWSHNLALSQIAAGQIDSAIDNLRDAIRINPRYRQAYSPLAHALVQRGRSDEALQLLIDHAALEPTDARAHYELAELARQLHRHGLVIRHLAQAQQLDPHNRDTLLLSAYSSLERGRFEEAQQTIDNLLARRPEWPEAHVVHAQLLHRIGENEAAWRILQPLIECGQSSVALAMVFAELADFADQRPAAIAMLETVLTDTQLPAVDRAAAGFALGKLYDRAHQYEQAFTQFQLANRLSHHGFDRQQFVAALDHMRRAKVGLGLPDPRPVLIVGMPRSGTTLVERILAVHPDVAAGGEMNHLARLCQHLDKAAPEQLAQSYLDKLDAISPTAQRITDKNPMNWQYLGPAARLLPGLRVIWCRRDPMAIGFSCYTQRFTGNYPWSYDLTDIGFVFKQHEQQMRHWQQTPGVPILELQYEQLVADPQKHGRALYEFCGLAWTDNALRFHELAAPATTASYEQVRKPIYTDANQKYKPYETWLPPLRDALS